MVDCGVLPTPALAAAALAEGTLSIMITGSHIPADRNGLKFYTGQGEYTKADEARLRDAMTTWSPARKVPETRKVEAADAYIRRFTEGLPTGALEGLRVGVWLHSSAAFETLPAILTGLGATVVPLGASERFVPVDTEAVAGEVRAEMARWARDHGLDAIVSTDGDADRPLMTDETGALLPGDILGAIAADWCGADEVVTTVSANSMVELMGRFDRVTRTKIGSPFVIAAMEDRARGGVGKIAGYEPNGGFLLGWDVTGPAMLPRLMTRDSTLPLVAVLARRKDSGRALSDYVAQLPARRTAADRLQNIPRERSLALVEAILAGDRSVLPDGLGALVDVDQTDGARLRFASDRILHIRPSGNAPELRCYVEAESQETAEATLKDALTRLAQAVAE